MTFFENAFDWSFVDYGPDYTAFTGGGQDSPADPVKRENINLRRLISVFSHEFRSLLAAAIEKQIEKQIEHRSPLVTLKTVADSADRSARPFVILGDDIRINQLLSNVLDNARKYSPSGSSVAVELTSTRQSVHLSVSSDRRSA